MNEHAASATVLGLRLRRLEFAGGVVSFVDEGTGPTVLLLHGAPFTSLGFVRVIQTLRVRYRVVAPDLPGFGRSSEGLGFDASLSGYARYIEDFCSLLDLRNFVLYGCDSSGCIGLAAAAKLAPRIAGLVVADTVPIPLTGRAWLVKMVLRHVLGSRVLRWLNRKLNLLPWLVYTLDPLRRPFSAKERATLIAEYDTPAKRDRILDVFAAMGYDDDFMRNTEEQAQRHLGDKPVLLLFGQFDPMRAVGSVSRFKAMFPRAQVRFVAHEKHFPIFASGVEVGAIIGDWMQTSSIAARDLETQETKGEHGDVGSRSVRTTTPEAPGIGLPHARRTESG